MKYINTETLTYPCTFETIVQEFPNTSFPPIFIPPYPYAKVVESTRPSFNKYTEYVKETVPIKVNDTWAQAWEVLELFATPQERDIALAEANESDRLNALAAAKKARDVAVAAIKVTTTIGNTFDGDETSQTRMTRAIIALQATNTPTTTWILANNIPTTVTVNELIEALALAGKTQTDLWVLF